VKWWLEDELKREDKYAEKTDFELEEAIKDALLYDPRTLSYKIDVNVSNRIATLNGIVDNLSAKKAAERDARNTIGILHVNNYLKVRPEEFPTDDKLEMNISNALLRDPIVNRFDISVTVLNKKAYLYGVVDEGYEKIRAESVASSVPGIVDVSNNITVRPFEWTWNSDENIKNNIEDEFFWSLLVDGDDINVSVTKGTAELKGSVDDWGEYYAAIDNAFEGGALNVEAHLKVESAGNRTINGYYKYPIWDFEYPFLIL
jgi:osmotically-inducible protein OsmY